MAERTRNVERLAAALRPNVEEVADALQGCLNDAVEAGARRTREEWGPRFDRQDETLRMIWKQVKGNGRLPIDD
jgi:hypothetical protein